MLLTIKNISLIKKAEVEFKGLTVITGLNDTGKSTVGKLMFSMIKAFSRPLDDFDQSKRRNISWLVERVYFSIRDVYDFSEDEKIREEFFPPRFLKEIINSLDLGYIEEAKNLLRNKTQIIDSLKIPDENKQEIIKKLAELKMVIVTPIEKKDSILCALEMAFKSEFNAELSSKLTSSNSFIGCSEGKNPIFEIRINENKVNNLDIFDELYFNDATYVETPVILQLYDAINKGVAFFELDEADSKYMRNMKAPKVPFHMKDLIQKLENTRYLLDLDLFNFIENNIADDIGELVGGKTNFNKKQRDFIYNKRIKNKDIKIKSNNTATGIKAFSILELLIEARMLHDRSLLIIDEPEIHLHPKWQVEYCRMLVELVQSGKHVLITSHSPYIIQALHYFSQKNRIQHKTNFYLSNKMSNEHMAIMEDVTEDLNKVFKKLSDPLQELVWGI